MKRLLTSLVAAAAVGLAAADGLGRATSAPAAQQPAQPQTPQAPEAAEAARLSRSVVELYRAGKYAEALPLAERALAIHEKASPPGDAAIGNALTNLALTLDALGKTDRARAAYERALPILESKLGGDAALTNQVRENFAASLFRKGEQEKAELLLQAVLASRERTLGAGHESVTHALVNLAHLYLATREAVKRDAVYSRLLDIAEKTPDQVSDELNAVLGRYVCTGINHPAASDEKKAIHERIRKLYESRREAGAQAATLSGGEVDGKAISKPAPRYPAQARQARVQGTVVLRITVDERGRVVEAEPLCGPRELYDATVAAARQARFTPTLRGGQPVKVKGTISYNFVIQ